MHLWHLGGMRDACFEGHTDYFFVCVIFQVKFQVCIPQRNWSPSSPPSKMLLRRMDSLDHSTTTFPTVSTVYLLIAQSVCLLLIISVCPQLCKTLPHVLFLLTDLSTGCSSVIVSYCIPASLMCTGVCPVEMVQCH